MNVEFTDNRIKVEAALDDAVIAFLYEAAGEVEAQTKRAQTRVDTGQTKGAWTHHVDEDKGEAVIGNPLENAIWEEYGTGEYALKGNGRKKPWVYKDERGKNKENGTFALTVECYADLSPAADTLPYHIYLPTGTTTEQVQQSIDSSTEVTD